MSEIEEIKERIKRGLLILKDKILEVSEYKEAILEDAQKYDRECEYWFDEYPYIYSQRILEENYITFERAVDEVICNKYYIEVELERLMVEIDGKDYILVLEVKEVKVEKNES
jgi:hypothetical protein